MKSNSDVVEEFIIGNRGTKLDYVAYLKKLKGKFVELLNWKHKVKVRRMYKIFMSHAGDDPWVISFEPDTVKISGKAGGMHTKLADEIVENIEKYVNNGSGWCFTYSCSLKLSVAKYKPFAGGSGKNFVLPVKIA